MTTEVVPGKRISTQAEPVEGKEIRAGGGAPRVRSEEGLEGVGLEQRQSLHVPVRYVYLNSLLRDERWDDRDVEYIKKVLSVYVSYECEIENVVDDALLLEAMGFFKWDEGLVMFIVKLRKKRTEEQDRSSIVNTFKHKGEKALALFVRMGMLSGDLDVWTLSALTTLLKKEQFENLRDAQRVSGVALSMTLDSFLGSHTLNQVYGECESISISSAEVMLFVFQRFSNADWSALSKMNLRDGSWFKEIMREGFSGYIYGAKWNKIKILEGTVDPWEAVVLLKMCNFEEGHKEVIKRLQEGTHFDLASAELEQFNEGDSELVYLSVLERCIEMAKDGALDARQQEDLVFALCRVGHLLETDKYVQQAFDSGYRSKVLKGNVMLEQFVFLCDTYFRRGEAFKEGKYSFDDTYWVEKYTITWTEYRLKGTEMGLLLKMPMSTEMFGHIAAEDVEKRELYESIVEKLLAADMTEEEVLREVKYWERMSYPPGLTEMPISEVWLQKLMLIRARS